MARGRKILLSIALFSVAVILVFSIFFTDARNIAKAESPVLSIQVEDDKYYAVWTPKSSIAVYKLSVDGVMIEACASCRVAITALLQVPKTYVISVLAKESGEADFSPYLSINYDFVKKLAMPENLRLSDGFLVWNNQAEAAGYEISVSVESSALGTVKFFAAEPSLRLSFSERARYKISVKALGGSKYYEDSEEALLFFDFLPSLDAPKNLNLCFVSGAVYLSWSAVANADGYAVSWQNSVESFNLTTENHYVNLSESAFSSQKILVIAKNFNGIFADSAPAELLIPDGFDASTLLNSEHTASGNIGLKNLDSPNFSAGLGADASSQFDAGKQTGGRDVSCALLFLFLPVAAAAVLSALCVARRQRGRL